MYKPSIKIVLRTSQVAGAVLFLAIALSGCQVGGSKAFVQGDTVEENNATYTGEPVTGDWVVMNMLDEPESLNPQTSTSASATNIYNGYIFESFLRTERKPPWGDEPLLVEKLPDVSEDHLKYTWNLRRDVYFHDGSNMTMHDAAFTLKAIMNQYVDNLPTKPYYAELDSIELPDDYTMVMFCSQPYFLHQEFLGGFEVLPKHVFDADGLMDDLTYFQVRFGSGFGNIADFLNDKKNANSTWDNIVDEIALAGLEKSLESSTDGAIKWDDLEEAIPSLISDPPDKRLDNIIAFLNRHPDGASGRQLAEDIKTSSGNALYSLPLSLEIQRRSSANDFPLRDSLAAVCKDIHDRIQLFGEQFNFHPHNRAPTVGSGPYKFERWLTGQEISLVRNENYWRGEGHAYLDRIVFRILTDYTASLVALKNGEIDFMESLQTIQYLTMTNRERFLNDFVKSTYLIPSYTYFGWRNTHPIFKDKRVRTAMTHMVRRQDAVDKLLFGFAEIVTGNFYKYGPDYNPNIVPLKYDPDKALELLHEAGWTDSNDDGILDKDGQDFRFEMLYPSGNPFSEQLCSILREDLYMIGIEMNIRRLEWSVFINNYIRNKNFDACYLGWVFGLKGDPKQVWHSESGKGRGSNHIEFSNTRADSLIDAARVEFDEKKRRAMYWEFQEILHEEQPYTFLFSTMRKPAYDKRFKGVFWYPFRPGYQFDEWFVPKEEQKYAE